MTLKNPTTPAIDGWAAHMRFTGAAESTVVTRSRVLRRLAAEAGEPLTLGKLDIVAWLAPYGTASTRSTVLAYLRAFYAWAHAEELIDTDPTARIPAVKVPSAKPRPANVDDIAAAMGATDERTRNMMRLMAYGGLRCCEVARFLPEHVEHRGDGWWVHIPHSKGGHVQAVPLPAAVAQQLATAEPWDVGAQSVQKRVRKALRDAGSSATPHMLRHYYGTAALSATQNLRQVQEMMRHASPATTARYTAVASDELTRAAESLPQIA